MEPLRGGALVNNLSTKLIEIIDNASTKKSPAGWAFKFLYNNPNISVVLSGMSNLEQIKENLDIVDKEGVALSITKDEEATINRLKEEFKSKLKVNCTGCKYCIDCPKNINIPECFNIWNNASMFNNFEKYKSNYDILKKEYRNASLCIKCGKCEKHCPQHINIIEKLKEVSCIFENNI